MASVGGQRRRKAAAHTVPSEPPRRTNRAARAQGVTLGAGGQAAGSCLGLCGAGRLEGDSGVHRVLLASFFFLILAVSGRACCPEPPLCCLIRIMLSAVAEVADRT